MIQVLLGIFALFGFVIKFMQFTLTAVTITAVSAFYFFVVTSLVSIYNKLIDIFYYVTTPTGGMVSCFFGAMECAGVTPALMNGLTAFYGVIVTVIVFHLMKFTFHAIKMIGNEIFKLGLLIGQALK